MIQKYISLGVLAVMGFLSIYFYYIYYPIHGEEKRFLFIYLFVISLLYGVIKCSSILMEKHKIEITAWKLILFFLLQLGIVCMCFFAFTVGNSSYGLVLFFKILFFLIPVTLLWINFYCLGNTILQKLKFLQIESRGVQILASLGSGFTIFMMGVFALMSLSLYSSNYIIYLLLFTIAISYKTWMQLGCSLRVPLKSYSHDLRPKASFAQRYNLGLIIDELHYIVITFLISVNLVSVFRPFPIGWDDLGAYMNYPKLLSGAGEHLALGKMYLWELYTGIGFLFGSQTFAFYLNSFSGIVAAIVIYLGISSVVKNRESSFDLGLFAAMIVLMMPMAVFQLSKDMKLDFGLLSLSIISLSVLYEAFYSKKSDNISMYVLVGVFIAVAFSIKVTSLLLLLGAIGALFYKKYSLGGFIGFICMFLGAFSYLQLWSMMNVVVSVEVEIMKSFAVVSMFLGVAICVVNHFYTKNTGEYLSRFCLQVGAILLGFVVTLLPWAVKHISALPEGKTISAKTLISGYSGFYKPDYSLIYSEEEIEEIKQNKLGLSESGTTTNEDFGRYFGYEDGINNYLKLPWNLTFQTNQGGEFTDISYVFFALIPALFLFLPYRRQEYKWPIVGVIGLALIYFIPGAASSYLTEIFAEFILPRGYFIIGAIALIPLAYFHFALDRSNKISQIFLVNFAFSTVYIGLWSISAFGIVWYGILMYFLFLVMISLCLLSVEAEGGELSKYSGYIALGIVWIYVMHSALPHGITNLKKTRYNDYKLGGMSEEVSLMRFHPEYFAILSHLNIADEQKQELLIDYRNRLLNIIDDTRFSEAILPQIQSVKSLSDLNSILGQIDRFDLKDPKASSQVEALLQSLYEDVIYADSDIQNSKKIYRVGTFLKYYISENNTRVLEDSLLAKFDDYIYDEDVDISIDRLNTLDIGYILLDINAATIDRDKRRSLTQRYEKMLSFVSNPNFQLVDTDSICLRVALDEYRRDGNIEKYMDIAGVNYSYKKSSQQKKEICVQEVVNIILNKSRLAKYPYLQAYVSALEKAEIPLDDVNAVGRALFQTIQPGSKVLFKIQE